MEPVSKFNLINGVPDSEQVEEWVENYFQNLLKMMNPFYAQIDLKDALNSIKAIRFDQLAAKELAGESPQIIEMATNLINQMADSEIEYMEAYARKE